MAIIQIVIDGVDYSIEDAQRLYDALRRIFGGSGWIPWAPGTPWYEPTIPQGPSYDGEIIVTCNSSTGSVVATVVGAGI